MLYKRLRGDGGIFIQSCSVRPDHVFFFNDTATTEIYTLSLHDLFRSPRALRPWSWPARPPVPRWTRPTRDRKSTRLNSSHTVISYAVFCLKKKKDDSLRDNNAEGHIIAVTPLYQIDVMLGFIVHGRRN